MKMFLTAAALATALLAGPAFADCASDMTKAEEAMKTVTLDDANMAKAKELTDKAKAAGDAKDEAACTAATTELLALLGVK